MRDIVFLFGAGASKGAGAIIPEAPPLGNPLFFELAKSFPGSWGSLPKEVEKNFTDSALGFERGMQLIYENFGTAIPQLMREMAIYFIQFRPIPGKSLYCKLIKRLIENGLIGQTVFSTLNYDCILELSLINQHVNIDYGPIQLTNSQNMHLASVLKLHGSCNMILKDINLKGASYSIGLNFEGNILASLDINFILDHFLNNTDLAPVMSLFMMGKPLAVAASAIRELQNSWREKILSAKNIFIIGVRPLIEDDHIWQPLSMTSAKLHYVGEQSQWEEWLHTRKSIKQEYLGNYFNSSFNLLLEKLHDCRTKH